MAKILVLDDDADLLRVVRLALTGAGYKVDAVTDSGEALAIAAGGSHDALILDLALPRLNGWDVLRRLRSAPSTRALPILILSGSSDAKTKVRGFRDGADDYLTKPFEPTELVVRLERLLAQRSIDTSDLQGSLDEHPLCELLPALEQNQKTGVLELCDGAERASIRLEDGHLVEAEYFGLERREAALAILTELARGRFSFERRKPGAPSIGHSLSLTPLLLEAAWLTDELKMREHHLPTEGDRLHLLAGGFEATSDEAGSLRDLPIATIVEHLRHNDGYSLSELLQQGLVAPIKARLIVAWLRAQGAVEVQEESSEARRVEELDIAIREFLQEVLFRGFSLHPVRVCMAAPTGLWGSLASLVQSIPPSLLGSNGAEARDRALKEHRGRLLLHHEAGDIEFSLAAIEPGARVNAPVVPYAATAVWLDEAAPEGLDAFIAQVESSNGGGQRLLIAASADRMLHERLVTDWRSWRLLNDPPRRIENMLLTLCGGSAG